MDAFHFAPLHCALTLVFRLRSIACNHARVARIHPSAEADSDCHPNSRSTAPLAHRISVPLRCSLPVVTAAPLAHRPASTFAASETGPASVSIGPSWFAHSPPHSDDHVSVAVFPFLIEIRLTSCRCR